MSWNVQGGGRRVEQQCSFITGLNPDVIALQEVTVNSIPAFKEHLQSGGFHYTEDSSSYVTDATVLLGPRRYTVVIASKWPLVRLSHEMSPWPERLLSVIVLSPFGETEVHCVYIPPGSSNGWTKIETLEGLYREMAQSSPRPRILCGDFNTPQLEMPDGQIVTWAQRVDKDGKVILCKSLGTRWDLGERNVFEGLSAFGLKDVYRQLYGYGVQEYSWYWRGRGKRVGRRFDHVFASESLKPHEFLYLHGAREEGLSDHSSVLCRFSRCTSTTT